MKLVKTSTIIAGMMALSLGSIAQRIKVIEGDLAPLKGESSISTEFTYDNMKVGKNSSEAEYIAKKTEDYNKKEPGRGDKWAKEWVADRKARFEPKFNELFEQGSEKTVKKDAKYTLVYKTIYTEPGYNAGILRKNAETNAEVWIMESASKKVIAKLTVEKALGRTFGGFDFDTGTRIAECYADAGKALGKYIRKQ